MSNHQGGYLLNDVIGMLQKEGVFSFLGQEKTVSLLKNIVEVARMKYDCNEGEILEDHGKEL